MLSDGNGEFTAAMGLPMDGSGVGLAPAPSATPPSSKTGSSPGSGWSRAPVSTASSAEEVLAAL